MKNKINQILILVVFLAINSNVFAQVGIGTTTPDGSAMLDVQSTTQGMLTPRMTSAERTAIENPAEGLLVFDTDAKRFYQFNGTIWEPIQGENSARTNYKLVQTEVDLSDELSKGGGSKYELDANTMYEINGTISVLHPIDLNNAYITGGDTSMDVLSTSSGDLFQSSKGGVVKNLTLIASSGSVFDLNDGVGNQVLMVRDCLINGSNAVGTISGYYWLLFDKLSFTKNVDGITYSNITDLSIDSNAWHGDNSGTFETFTGTFSAIQKNSGFSVIPPGATGIDVSSNPEVDNGVIFATVFNNMGGTVIESYTTHTTDSHWNFPKQWVVDCVGLPVERDEIATANMYWDIPIGSFVRTDLLGGNITKLNGDIETFGANVTNSNLLFRFEKTGSNRLTYRGNKPRLFQVSCNGSYRPDDAGIYVFYIVKVLNDGSENTDPDYPSRSVREAEKDWNKNDDGGIFTFGMTGLIRLEPGESVEMHAEYASGSENKYIDIYSLNFNIF